MDLVSDASQTMPPSSHLLDVTNSLDFADGYGTSFQCTSVCHFITIAFALAIGLFLVLLFVLPVSTTKYVKSTRKRVVKRPLDQSNHPRLAQYNSSAIDIARETMVSYSQNETSLDDEVGCDPMPDTSQCDFISSLSQQQQQKQPLLKYARAANSVSPRRRHTDQTYPFQIPVAAPRYTSAQVPQGDNAFVNKADGNFQKEGHASVGNASYENLRDDEIKVQEYHEFVQSLLKGFLVKRIKFKGHAVKISKCHFTATPDLTRLKWYKQEGMRVLKKMETVLVKDIVGITTGMLANVGTTSSGTMYLSLLHADNTSLDLQAENEAMHQKLYNGFSMLLREQVDASMDAKVNLVMKK
ncbi:hypothetical protein Ae201684P_000268 [Aphanomyces euteiches]|nr:hypothetical protein Ae201684P_000268 [Aphanomyces euteiches]